MNDACLLDIYGYRALVTSTSPVVLSGIREDFAYFLQACPGAYIIVGGGKTGADPGLHSPHYDFNDETLPIGAAYWVRLAETWLK